MAKKSPASDDRSAPHLFRAGREHVGRRPLVSSCSLFQCSRNKRLSHVEVRIRLPHKPACYAPARAPSQAAEQRAVVPAKAQLPRPQLEPQGQYPSISILAAPPRRAPNARGDHKEPSGMGRTKPWPHRLLETPATAAALAFLNP